MKKPITVILFGIMLAGHSQTSYGPSHQNEMKEQTKITPIQGGKELDWNKLEGKEPGISIGVRKEAPDTIKKGWSPIKLGTISFLPTK